MSSRFFPYLDLSVIPAVELESTLKKGYSPTDSMKGNVHRESPREHIVGVL